MDESTPTKPECYRVAEVAKLLRIGERQCREAIIRREIPCFKIGSQVRCSRVAIHRWLDGGEEAALPSLTLEAALARLSPEEQARLSRAISRAIVAALDELAAAGRPDA